MEKREFDLLNHLYKNRTAATPTAGEDETALAELCARGWIDAAGHILPDGAAAMEPYRVRSAIVMAAGFASRFVPLSSETPKGLLTVRGEVMIERQIEQLQAAGVPHIYVVVGYKMEQFFYLAEKYGVMLIVNPTYAIRNNIGTLYVAREFLGNTYICSSDNYFTENVFETYVYDSYYSLIYIDEQSPERFAELDENDRILRTFYGGKDMWALIGHAYLSDAFCRTYLGYLEEAYGKPETDRYFWEYIFYEHLDELAIYARKYPAGVVWEFDSLEELKVFDPTFLQAVDSTDLMNVCDALHVTTEDIRDVKLLRRPQPGTAFTFTCGGEGYAYIADDESTSRYADREAAAFAARQAAECGIDADLVIADPVAEYRVVHYAEPTRAFSFAEPSDVAAGAALLKRLHTCGAQGPFTADRLAWADQYALGAPATARKAIAATADLHDRVEALNTRRRAEAWQTVLCHGDLRASAFGVTGERVTLGEWTYAAMEDGGFDVARYAAAASGAEELLSEAALTAYFGREVTAAERRHVLSCLAVDAYARFVEATDAAARHLTVRDDAAACLTTAEAACAAAEKAYTE